MAPTTVPTTGQSSVPTAAPPTPYTARVRLRKFFMDVVGESIGLEVADADADADVAVILDSGELGQLPRTNQWRASNSANGLFKAFVPVVDSQESQSQSLPYSELQS
mmetsp:Transcript_21305/g.59289  ORF Transcript_21305/g.59289 Transcript_21305/m.59289 type:complete len:107 (+) Transcript_21305:420-740(+)